MRALVPGAVFLMLLLVVGSVAAQEQSLESRVSEVERRLSDSSAGLVLFLVGAFCALWAQNTLNPHSGNIKAVAAAHMHSLNPAPPSGGVTYRLRRLSPRRDRHTKRRLSATALQGSRHLPRFCKS